MNEDNLGWFTTLKHLTQFDYEYNGITYSVGGNKYNAYSDIATLIGQISGTVTDKEKMINALPIAQEKIAQSMLPQAEKAEWTRYLVSYVIQLKKQLDNPGLRKRVESWLDTFGKVIETPFKAPLSGLTKPIIPIIIIAGIAIVGILYFLPKVITPYGSIEGKKK